LHSFITFCVPFSQAYKLFTFDRRQVLRKSLKFQFTVAIDTVAERFYNTIITTINKPKTYCFEHYILQQAKGIAVDS